MAAPLTPPLAFVNAEACAVDQPLSPRLIELVRNGLPFREVLEFTDGFCSRFRAVCCASPA